MKRNFKKIISLFLTVVMLVSLLIPVTVNADTAEPIYLEKNTTKTINGVTYRFDVADANDESVWARLNPDGTWEVSIRNGDMLWFPGIALSADSVIYGEFTNTSNGCVDLSSGLAYGVKSEGDQYTTGSSAVIRTGTRIRVTPISPDGLFGYNGSDGYGNGGDSPRMIDNVYLTANSAYDAMKGPNGNWGSGKTVYFEISSADGNVNVEMGAPGNGSFYNGKYSLASNPKGAYDGGSVGFVVSYQGGEDTLTQIRYDKITITNCKVDGELKDSYSLGVAQDDGEEPDEPVVPPVHPGEPVYLEKNKTATINGITYRFDTNTTKNPDSWARINPDGTFELNFRYGDTLWFPDVELTSASTIHAEITNTSNSLQDESFSGLAYGITADSDGRYASEMVAAICYGARMRIARATYDGNHAASDGIGGNGGYDRLNSYSSEYSATWNTNSNWTNNTDNGNLKSGATVFFDIKKTDSGDVSVSYGSGNSVFVTRTYNNNSTFENKTSGVSYPYEGGAVGISSVYTRTSGEYTQYRIEDLTVNNCKVGGVEKASYSIKAVEAKAENAMISLSLDGTIGLNFAFNASNLANATVVATKNGVEVVNQPVVNGENIVTVPVNAKEMTDDINFSIKVDGEVFENHTYTVSVAEYAANLFEDEDWGDLMHAMLNYGAAAQMALNYKTNDLAADISGGITYDFSEYEAITFTGDTDILDGLYMNLVLESDTAFKVYFKPATGVELAVTVNGEAAELTENGDGYYVLTVGNIAADKLVDDFAIVVNEKLSFAVNALDWAKIANEGTDANLATLAKALAAYATAAASKN